MPLNDTSQQKGRRSREGCVECRRRHRKCDETRPSCQNCQASGKACAYTRQISFGGRPFHKSRFGKCLEANVTLINAGPVGKGKARAQFFYGLKTEDKTATPTDSTRATPAALDQNSSDEASAVESVFTIEDRESHTPDSVVLQQGSYHYDLFHDANPARSGQNEIRSLSPILASLPIRTRPLVEYFVHKASIALCSNRSMHNAICTTFIPMALESPHLLSAVMALASAHRRSAGLDIEDVQLRYWQLNSIEQLRLALAHDPNSQEQGALATSLMLCLTEAVSHDEDAGRGQSWRAHLQGATTLLKLMEDGEASTPAHRVPEPIKRIHRCLLNIASCLSLKYTSTHSLMNTARILPFAEPIIDEFLGYSTNLLPVFEEVYKLSSPEDTLRTQGITNESRTQRFKELAKQVHTLLEERRIFVELETADRTTQNRRDLLKLDEAYHHTALLVIYNRGFREMPEPATRDGIDCIIKCIKSMHFATDEPAPVAGSLPPLFIAGCLSHDTATRETISFLLDTLWQCYGMGNVRNTQSYLQKLWQSLDAAPESHTPAKLPVGMIDLTCGSSGSWDFLPY